MSVLLWLVDFCNIYDTFLLYLYVMFMLRLFYVDHLIYISVTFSSVMFHICLDVATICIDVTTVLFLVFHSDQILSNTGGHVH